MERIYIGGLDPPRLTADEVAARLEQGVDGVQIRSKDLYKDKSFFYVNAISDDDASALSKISKRYNNVTWKQCRLVVEAARPHFLDRLAGERLERERNVANTAKEAQEVKHSKIESTRTRGIISRHLRIRQRFGEEAFHVDTKPAATSDWSDFAHVVSKLRTRREQHRSESMDDTKRQALSQSLLAKKRAFRNRAVHLRWSGENNGDRHGRSLLVHYSSDHPPDAEVIATNSDSVFTSNSESEQQVNGSHSGYVWSDDDAQASRSNSGNSGVMSETETTSSNGSHDSFESIEEEETNTDNQSAARYEWSSDETDQEEARPPLRVGVSEQEPASAKPTSEEFSAAIDFESISFGGDDDRALPRSSERITDVSAECQNLDQDVATNLSVFASLFPDVTVTTPMSLDHGTNTDGTQEKSNPKVAQPGWEEGSLLPRGVPSMSDGLGLMQRFDPTKDSAKKYIVEPQPATLDERKDNEAEAESDNTESGSEERDQSLASKSLDDSPELDSILVPTGTIKDDSKLTVYEQRKLEDIFREARSSGGSNENKAFAFGFDVGGETDAGATGAANLRVSPRENKSFTFSFDLGATNEDKSIRPDEEVQIENAVVDAVPHQEVQDTSMIDESDDRLSKSTQRRGFLFPTETLDKYTNAFFAMNEGSRILQDPQGFLTDENVRQLWKKERYSLTLDWKRKRKYAQSRMQKKMKFR